MRRWYLLAAAPFALVVAFVTWPAFGAMDHPLLNAYNISAVTSAVVLVVVVARRHASPSWPWFLIAASELLWVVGDGVYAWLGTLPTLSIADAFYVAGYLGLIISLLGFLRMRARASDVDSLLDGAMVGVTAALFLWELVVEPTWGTPGVSAAGRLATAAYPLLDVILLVLLVRILILPGRRPVAAMLLLAGIGWVFVGDVAYALLQQTEAYADVGRLLDATWLLGYALLPLAAVHSSMSQLTARSEMPRPGRGRLLAPAIALLAIPGVAVAAQLTGREAGGETMAFAAAAVVPLVLWRIARSNRFQEQAQVELASRERYYRALASHASDAFLVVDEAGIVLDASDALAALLGYTPEQAVGADARELIAETDQELALALLTDTRSKPNRLVVGEVRVRTAAGEWIWVEIRCTNLLSDPAVGGIVVNAHDISRRKRVEDELAHQAFHDSLTDLPNRALLRDRIDHALSRRIRSGDDVVVLYCDLDGFKSVNDTLGHDAGDELLRIAAHRLRSAVRPGDTVARIGGDEFAVLLEGAGLRPEDGLLVADRMRDAIADPVEIEGTPLVVTASFGLAAASDADDVTAAELLRDADAAMYGAKKAGRNRTVRYEPGLRAEALERAQLEADLRDAVARDELVLHYQPVIELASGVLTGYEALVRWQHPTRGLLSPGAFIGLAEETGMIVDIGTWVLHEACRAATRLQAEVGRPDLTMSVNVSAHQLARPDLPEHVRSALALSGMQSDRLVLELTESVLIDEPDEVAERLDELKALGARLAIDDFGVGYSSLSYLRQFPVDILKIDRSFINTIGGVDRIPAIVHGLFELGRALELETIAEGIETEDQLRSLQTEGCQLGQGFLFARPVEEAAAAELARQSATPMADRLAS